MTDTPTVYFDTGQREQLDERTTWHGNAWYTGDDRLRLPVGPKTHIWVGADGSTAVYHDGRRAW